MVRPKRRKNDRRGVQLKATTHGDVEIYWKAGDCCPVCRREFVAADFADGKVIAMGDRAGVVLTCCEHFTEPDDHDYQSNIETVARAVARRLNLDAAN